MSSAESTEQEEMRVNPQRASELASNLSNVLSKIQKANPSSRPVRLIAVSKLKPPSDVLALVQSPSPHLHYGENYLQELQHKASILPPSIKWSFIGALQTNKCVPLAQIPNLWAVSSVDSVKKADALEKGRKSWLESEAGKQRAAEYGSEAPDRARIRVFVQVNTSGEESKSGVEPGSATLELCRHIRDHTPHLKLQGLMTIGAIARSQASAHGEENEDFTTLRRERDAVVRNLGMTGTEEDVLELSMGMSADFEEAIRAGSDEVRVGSGIFGERPPRREQQTKAEVEGGKE